MRSAYLAIDLVIAVGLLSLAGVSLLRQGYKNPLNKLFTLLSIFVAFWIVANNISNNTANPSIVATFCDYIVFSASFGSYIILTQFVVKLASINRLERLVNRMLVPLWAVCALSATPLVTASVEIQGDVYAVIFGPLVWLYGLGLFFMTGLTGYGIFHGLRHTMGIRRRQLKIISIGLAFTIPLVLLLSFIIPSMTGIFSVTEFGITPVIVLVISLYYSVVKYQFLDIRQALVRTVTYTMSLLTLSAVYYGIAYLISVYLFNNNSASTVGVNPINIALALLLSFIFQPVKKFFDKITNRVFYKDNYNTDDFFARLNKTLSVTTDLRGLLERVAYEISGTLKAEQAFFFIYTNADGNYVSTGTENHNHLPKHDAILVEQESRGKSDIISESLLDEKNPIRRMMICHRIELILPLIQDGAVIGYLCLGEHLTSGYTNRDIKVLNTLSNALIIAIQNALAIHEIRELNLGLQQKIANATSELRANNTILRQLDKVKDEFIGMASHQLRTPLTSVKGYLSMVLEGDAGKITNPQRQFLNEAYLSSERMVGLINDFLNVSRIQTGKFVIDKTEVDLSKLVGEEIASLQPNAAARNIKFVYKQPNKFPILSIDEGKIRQVVMNFSDNAIYYSHEGTSINVSLKVEDNKVVFMVKDTGIGVPVDERKHLFTKFYRASNARKQRPDGTGVGIYLAKKIIDAHGGKLIFESTEGKGSTFGFSLPIQ